MFHEVRYKVISKILKLPVDFEHGNVAMIIIGFTIMYNVVKILKKYRLNRL